jgi:hypothetical protein
MDKYKGMTMVQIQNGSTVNIWSDLWNDKVRETTLLELFSFTIINNIIVHQAKNMDVLHDIFQLPLSIVAFQ